MGNHKNKFTRLNQRDWFFQLRFCHDASEIPPVRDDEGLRIERCENSS